MTQRKESELILNPDGSVFHLGLLPEDIANTIITVGDQNRVEKVSKYFDHLEVKKHKREFITHTGTIGSKRLTVISSGIGTDNIDIVMNELDALVNIDLSSGEVKSELSSLNIIRVGTSGAMRADLEVGSILCSEHVIGLDGLMHAYKFEDHHELTTAFVEYCNERLQLYIRPYSASANYFFPPDGLQKGITLTCNGFYGPQFRKTRLHPIEGDFISQVHDFEFGNVHLTNIEMETSALFSMSKMLGHRAMSVNAILANRATGEFTKDSTLVVENLIESILEKLVYF
jgi:uridine phosphorylase